MGLPTPQNWLGIPSDICYSHVTCTYCMVKNPKKVGEHPDGYFWNKISFQKRITRTTPRLFFCFKKSISQRNIRLHRPTIAQKVNSGERQKPSFAPHNAVASCLCFTEEGHYDHPHQRARGPNQMWCKNLLVCVCIVVFSVPLFG